MKCLVIDELYMVSSNLWIDVDSRLEEILIVIPQKNIWCYFSSDSNRFASTTSSQRKTYISRFCDKDSIKHMLDLQL